VHHSITFYHQLDAQTFCLFTYNTLIKILLINVLYVNKQEFVHQVGDKKVNFFIFLLNAAQE
jgi:hypothetical protein